MKINEVIESQDKDDQETATETATAGGTSAGNVAGGGFAIGIGTMDRAKKKKTKLIKR